MTDIRVLHEPTADRPFLVLDKPAGLPTAPLYEGDDSALTRALKLFHILSAVSGRKSVEKGLVHRIDTQTRGLVLIASTQSAYDALIESQKRGLFVKYYTARVDRIPDAPKKLGGFPPQLSAARTAQKNLSALQTARGTKSADAAGAFQIHAESFFRAFGAKGATVRPVTAESGRAASKKSAKSGSSPVLYATDITLQTAPMPEPGASSACTALCRISAGYRHQVRCHLAWCGFPVHGDALYNPAYQAGEALCFCASRFSFPNPARPEEMVDIRL